MNKITFNGEELKKYQINIKREEADGLKNGSYSVQLIASARLNCEDIKIIIKSPSQKTTLKNVFKFLGFDNLHFDESELCERLCSGVDEATIEIDFNKKQPIYYYFNYYKDLDSFLDYLFQLKEEDNLDGAIDPNF